MKNEFAVDPKAIAKDWQIFRYVFGLFGFKKGRLISQFPKNWFAEVYKAIEEADKSEEDEKAQRSSGRDKIRIKLEEERKREMANGDCRVKKFGRRYDRERRDWVSNAVEEHRRNPFGAIITKNLDENQDFLSAEDFEEDELIGGYPSEATLDAIISDFEIFLRFGRKIAFIDPYFRIDREKEDHNVRSLLSRCLDIVGQYNPEAECEIHYRDQDNANMPPISYIEGKALSVSRLIPQGMSIKICCWRKTESISFHDRYLLCEKGGVSIPKGFRLENYDDTITSYLSAEKAESIYNNFTENDSGHHIVEPPLRIFSDGRTERIQRVYSNNKQEDLK